MMKENVSFYKAGSTLSYSSVLALSGSSTFCHGVMHQKTYPLITDSNIQNKKMHLLLSFLFL